jgi:hypothetical protein
LHPSGSPRLLPRHACIKAPSLHGHYALHRYYEPIRLPIQACLRLCLPASRWWLAHHPAGSPRFLDQSVHARCPLLPRKVRRMHSPVASSSVAGFSFLGRMATSNTRNEAEMGSLMLRLTCSPHQSSKPRLLATTLVRLPAERAIRRMNSFQFTRSARLILAVPKDAKENRSNFEFHAADAGTRSRCKDSPPKRATMN